MKRATPKSTGNPQGKGVRREGRGGAQPGAGRPKKAVRFADLKTITDKELESIVRDEVPTAMRELVRGVTMGEPTKTGTRIYQVPPNLGAIIACLDRVFGKVADKMEHTGNVTTEVHVSLGSPRKPAVE